MTDHDIALLALGAAIGVELMVLVQAVFQIRDNRRSAARTRAAQVQLDEARARADA